MDQDEFDRMFPGWRDKRSIPPEDEESRWPAAPAPKAPRRDDIYADLGGDD